MPKLYLYGAIFLTVVGLIGGTYWKGRTAGEAAGNARAEQAEQQRDSAIAALRASQEASANYAAELESIRNRPTRTRVVRLCSAADVPVPGPTEGTADSSGGAGGVPAADGGHSGPGPDIGPDLMALAQDGDQCSAQLRALQGWVKDVARPPSR